MTTTARTMLHIRSQHLVLILVVTTLFACSKPEPRLQGTVYNDGTRSTTTLEFELVRAELDSLDQPLLMKSSGDELFVADRYDTRVEVYGLDGTWKRAIGHGRGNAPGEITNIIDMAIGDDFVDIADNRSRIISRFTKGGEYITRISVAPHIPLRLVSTEQHITVQPGTSDSTFVSFDLEGNEMARFGDIAGEEPVTGFLDGMMVRADSDSYFIALHQAGLLLKYRFDGTLESTIRTIEGLELGDIPPIRVATPGNPVSAQQVPVLTKAISLTPEHVYLLSLRSDINLPSAERTIQDRYLRGTGQYDGSYSIPFETRHVQVVGKRIYVLNQFDLYSANLN